MKQKTFIFSEDDLRDYKSNVDEYCLTHYKINWHPDYINKTIDDFLKGKDVISISTSCITVGNNPPKSALIYVVVYK